MIRSLTNIFRMLTSPVGDIRWGQYPKSRMSLLSVIAFAGFASVMIGGIVLKSTGFNFKGSIASSVVFGTLFLVFLSGAFDNRRDRR